VINEPPQVIKTSAIQFTKGGSPLIGSSNLGFIGSLKPPMSQANVKRSHITAAKGDSEPQSMSTPVAKEEEPSIFGNVFNRVISMIGGKPDETNLEAPAIISRGFVSQD
jgi:hypothetical protein